MAERNVLVGPEETATLPRWSFGKLMYDGIKAKNKDEVSLIDAFSKSETTYGEILETTRQLACGLRKLGLRKSDVVSIINETTVHYTYPILSCIYLGATINPLNPGYSKNEFLHALAISRPRFIICCETVLDTILALRIKVPSVEQIIVIGKGVAGETIDLDDVLAQGSDSVNDFEPLDAPDIDYERDVTAILCSSGTTGLAKGVMLTHKNIRAPMTYLNDDKFRCVGSEGDIQIGVAPGFHILGLAMSLTSLYYNSKVIMMEKFKPDVYLKTIEDFKVTRLIIVPSLGVFLAKSPLVLNYDVSSVKDIVCGAAVLGKDVQQLLNERFQLRVRQCYGMTETTGAITFCPRPELVGTIPQHSVGTVVPGISVKFSDLETNESLPAHRTGEIRAKGYMTMKGYAGDAGSTQAIFDAEGYLCTGDIGYYDDDGNVFIVDRLKELIKYKGFQVPPAELEDILLSHPEVKDAGVIGIPDERSGELPFAFVVKQPGAIVDEAGIISYVKELVSIQKQLHGGVRFIDEIPKNTSGKILRRKLRDLYQMSTD